MIRTFENHFGAWQDQFQTREVPNGTFKIGDAVALTFDVGGSLAGTHGIVEDVGDHKIRVRTSWGLWPWHTTNEDARYQSPSGYWTKI